MKSLNRSGIILVVSLCFGLNINYAYAQEICDYHDPEPTYFKSLYEKGVALGKGICESILDDGVSEELNAQYREFAETAVEAINQGFANKSFYHSLVSLMNRFKAHTENGVDRASLPSINNISGMDLDGNSYLRFSAWDDLQVEVPVNSDECNVQGEPRCSDLISAFEIALNQYQKPSNHLAGKEIHDLAVELEGEWRRYYDESRPQTLLDSMFTSYMEHDYISQDRLVRPMARQWFVVHPSLVVENISDAEDGDQFAPALAMEWIGVNWWDKETSPIGYPVGISLTSVYSDRSSAEDIGHGLTFHFNNSFSLGLTDHDGDTGVYVTVDVLNFFTEKKQLYNQYKDDIDNIQAILRIKRQ